MRVNVPYDKLFFLALDESRLEWQFTPAVRPKHPPLRRTKFVGFTALCFQAARPKCCARQSTPIPQPCDAIVAFFHQPNVLSDY